MVLTLLVNAPLTSPLLRWIVQMDRSQDGEGRHQFRLGIEQLAARTKAHIATLGANPQCGLPPHWETVEELVTSFSSKVTDKFPVAGAQIDSGHDYDIDVQGQDSGDCEKHPGAPCLTISDFSCPARFWTTFSSLARLRARVTSPTTSGRLCLVSLAVAADFLDLMLI